MLIKSIYLTVAFMFGILFTVSPVGLKFVNSINPGERRIAKDEKQIDFDAMIKDTAKQMNPPSIKRK